MNKLFGFFKQKIVEANVQNKKDIEILVNALNGDDTGYKSQIIFSHLQKIKNNYMTWNILIANQASTGLYYSQLHNHAVCLKKANLDPEFQKTFQKYTITQNQMRKTHQELQEIGSLSENWVKNISQNIEQIKKLRTIQLQQKKQKRQMTLSKSSQNQSKVSYSQITKQKIKEEQNPLKQPKRSPIIVSEITKPIISFSEQKNEDQIIIKFQKW